VAAGGLLGLAATADEVIVFHSLELTDPERPNGPATSQLPDRSVSGLSRSD
jgi:hypothetical protein